MGWLGWCPKSRYMDAPRGVVTMGDVHLDRDNPQGCLWLKREGREANYESEAHE